MLVKLRMQYCGEIFQNSFETYKTFYDIITEFERKVDVKNRFFINYYKTMTKNEEKNSTENLLDVQEHISHLKFSE